MKDKSFDALVKQCKLFEQECKVAVSVRPLELAILKSKVGFFEKLTRCERGKSLNVT